MKVETATKLAQAIQLLQLDSIFDYTNKQLSTVSGVALKTISRNRVIVTILDFAIFIGGCRDKQPSNQ